MPISGNRGIAVLSLVLGRRGAIPDRDGVAAHIAIFDVHDMPGTASRAIPIVHALP
jgi:hypothetical protein